MKWKIKPCFIYRTYGDLFNEVKECFETSQARSCIFGDAKDITWETCPHGKCKLVEEEDEQ